MKKLIALIFILVLTVSFQQAPNIYTCSSGEVKFISDAPLEFITAESSKLIGVLDISSRSFSFKISSQSFQGFNSSLQRTHFNEDFMESELFPNSTFKGKIIEEIDFTIPGKHTIRAKGKLTVHGIEYDRIIRCTAQINSNSIQIDSKFTVFLDDHDISIPTIVNQKIAEEITVEIQLILTSG